MLDLKTKTDDEFFELYCSYADMVFNNGEEQLIFIKDKDLKSRYRSPAIIKNVSNKGFFNPQRVEVPESMREEYEIVERNTHAQDLRVKEELKSYIFIYVDVYNQIGIVQKRPIVNPATGNFVGILGLTKPFQMPNILSLIYKIHDINFGLVNKPAKDPLKHNLTVRQSMVLFLYLNKYSNTEITNIFNALGYKISKSRINDHLENLKLIFQVKTKEQLIEKAISYGYHLQIPRQFLKFGSYELNDDAIIL